MSSGDSGSSSFIGFFFFSFVGSFTFVGSFSFFVVFFTLVAAVVVAVAALVVVGPSFLTFFTSLSFVSFAVVVVVVVFFFSAEDGPSFVVAVFLVRVGVVGLGGAASLAAGFFTVPAAGAVAGLLRGEAAGGAALAGSFVGVFFSVVDVVFVLIPTFKCLSLKVDHHPFLCCKVRSKFSTVQTSNFRGQFLDPKLIKIL